MTTTSKEDLELLKATILTGIEPESPFYCMVDFRELLDDVSLEDQHQLYGMFSTREKFLVDSYTDNLRLGVNN